MCSCSWSQLHALNISARWLAFVSSVSLLASFSSSLGGSKEMLMVLVSKKGPEVWSLSETRWSSLRRGDKCAGSKVVGVLMLDGLGGLMREVIWVGVGLVFLGLCGNWLIVRWMGDYFVGGGASFLGGGLVSGLTS